MKNWQLKEKKDAKFLGGNLHKGSGNRWYRPGDSSNEAYLCESKYTEKKSYSINKSKLNKLYEEALFSKKIPLLSIQIQDMDVVVIFKEDFQTLLKNQKKNQL